MVGRQGSGHARAAGAHDDHVNDLSHRKTVTGYRNAGNVSRPCAAAAGLGIMGRQSENAFYFCPTSENASPSRQERP